MRLACFRTFTLAFFLPTFTGRQPAPSPRPPADLEARLNTATRLNLQPSKLPIQIPKDQRIGMISWLDFDPRTRTLWLIQRGLGCPPILALDPKTGRILHAFGQGSFRIPHAIRVAPDGNIWTVDAGTSQVLKWTPEGQKLLTLNLAPPSASSSAPNTFAGATDIAFTPANHLLLTDGYRNARILEYSAHGQLLRQWGTPGTAPGQFNLPHALLLDDAGGILYIADRENARIQKFTLQGKFLAEFDGLGRIYDLALGTHGTLWASTQPLADPPGSPGYILQLDRTSGKLLGYLPVPKKGGLHTITTDSQGQPLTDLGNTILYFRAANPPRHTQSP